MNETYDIREKAIRKAYTWSVIALCLPVAIFALPQLDLKIKLIATAVVWVIPMCLSFLYPQKRDTKEYTFLPNIISLPLSAAAVYFANEYVDAELLSPWWFAIMLALICFIYGIAYGVHSSIMQAIDYKISPKEKYSFTTRVVDKFTRERSRGRRSFSTYTEYYVVVRTNTLEKEEISVSAAGYNEYKLGDVWDLNIQEFVINRNDYKYNPRRVSDFVGVTDYEKLAAKMQEEGKPTKLDKTNASQMTGIAYGVIAAIGIWIGVYLETVNNALKYARWEYLYILIPIICIAVATVCIIAKKIKAKNGEEDYEIYKDKICRKLFCYIISLTLFAGMCVGLYNQNSAGEELFEKRVECKTKKTHQSRSRGRRGYDTYHTYFEIDNVKYEIRSHSSDMGADSVNVSFKKGLFGVPVVMDYKTIWKSQYDE